MNRLRLCRLAQVLGILADQEGRRFGRRMASVLPPLVAQLAAAAATMSAAEGLEAEGAAEGAAVVATGWREPYAGLLLFERLTRQVHFCVFLSDSDCTHK